MGFGAGAESTIYARHLFSAEEYWARPMRLAGPLEEAKQHAGQQLSPVFETIPVDAEQPLTEITLGEVELKGAGVAVPQQTR